VISNKQLNFGGGQDHNADCRSRNFSI